MNALTTHSDFVEEVERRRLGLTIGLLKVYSYYRVALGLTFLFVISQTTIETRLGSLLPIHFEWGALAYTGINILSVLLIQIIPPRFFERQLPNFALVLYDILALTLLMYCSAGVTSGMTGLILIAVAAGAIVCTGRRATLIAALATLAVLGEEFYLSLGGGVRHDYFQAGVAGMSYFALSLLIQTLSNRLRQNDLRALTQAAELEDLERINRLIVQRMRTGIILVNEQGGVRMANQSAKALIGQVGETDLDDVPQALADQLQAWRDNTGLRTPPFQVAQGAPEIRVNFQPVRELDPTGDITIFLEDTGEIQQQAQSLKLASLGRLSASIAHEIRNPLGAISHAAQLLSESEVLSIGDQRLTDIIHKHCQRMNSVIQNVLEMSRRTPPKPVRLRMQEFLDEFCEAFHQSAPDAQIDVVVEQNHAEIRIDNSQMQQVLTNLVSNGIRYSQAHSGVPSIRLHGGIREQTDRPYLLIIDDGPGVDDERIANLFEPFFTTETQGTGLGLYIAKELCETNQARLSYERAQSGGSCFRITFAHPDRITI